MSAPESSDPGPTTCPRCGAPLRDDQDWCVECGAPARTRLAPTPNWHIPAALLAVVVALAGAALAVAFVQLTKDDAPPAQATTAAPAPAEGVPPVVPTTPAVTSSVATTPPTGTTTVPTTVTEPPPPVTVPGQTPTGTTPAATSTTPTTTSTTPTQTTP